MWAKKQAPDGSFKFVVFRPDWNPRVEYTEQNGTEIRKSLCIAWPDDFPLPDRVPGREATFHPTREKPETCMLFLATRYLFDRITKLGWVDVTDLWSQGLERRKRLADGKELPPLGDPVGDVIAPGKAAAPGRHAAKEPEQPSKAPAKQVEVVAPPPPPPQKETAPSGPVPPQAGPTVSQAPAPGPAEPAVSPEALRARDLLELDNVTLERTVKTESSMVIRLTLGAERMKPKPRSGAIKILEVALDRAIKREAAAKEKK